MGGAALKREGLLEYDDRARLRLANCEYACLSVSTLSDLLTSRGCAGASDEYSRLHLDGCLYCFARAHGGHAVAGIVIGGADMKSLLDP